jgi:hypothetical protein
MSGYSAGTNLDYPFVVSIVIPVDRSLYEMPFVGFSEQGMGLSLVYKPSTTLWGL